MKIISKDSILSSDIQMNQVVVVPGVELAAEPSHTILAGTRLKTSKDPEGVDILVIYHKGMQSWALQTEYRSIQERIRFHFGTLPDVINRFKDLAGVTLPEIKVTEYGVGIYPAAGGEIINPWGLIDGETYEVTRDGKRFGYKAKINERGEIRVVNQFPIGPNGREAYDPREIFSKEMWLSLNHIGHCIATSSHPLYHVTDLKHLKGIAADGLHRGSFWSMEEDLSDYYAETIHDECGTPVILKVDLYDLDPAFLLPDMPGIEEPITTVLHMSEAEVQEKWESSKQSWKDSLEIINSVKYNRPIPVADLCVINDAGETQRLDDYLVQHGLADPQPRRKSPGM